MPPYSKYLQLYIYLLQDIKSENGTWEHCRRSHRRSIAKGFKNWILVQGLWGGVGFSFSYSFSPSDVVKVFRDASMIFKGQKRKTSFFAKVKSQKGFTRRPTLILPDSCIEVSRSLRSDDGRSHNTPSSFIGAMPAAHLGCLLHSSEASVDQQV
jgi:hypothetical protein